MKNGLAYFSIIAAGVAVVGISLQKKPPKQTATTDSSPHRYHFDSDFDSEMSPPGSHTIGFLFGLPPFTQNASITKTYQTLMTMVNDIGDSDPSFADTFRQILAAVYASPDSATFQQLIVYYLKQKAIAGNGTDRTSYLRNMLYRNFNTFFQQWDQADWNLAVKTYNGQVGQAATSNILDPNADQQNILAPNPIVPPSTTSPPQQATSNSNMLAFFLPAVSIAASALLKK